MKPLSLPLSASQALQQANRRTAKTLRRMPLWLEIALVLVTKAVLLFVLWQQFFSHPQAKHMLLPAATVQQHFFALPNGNGQQASQPQASNPSNEVKHGTD
jgi:hypothetical protein